MNDGWQSLISELTAMTGWEAVAVILAILGLLPGMPHMIVLPAAAAAAGIAWWLSRPKPAAEPDAEEQAPQNPNIIDWQDVSDGALLGIEIGYALVPLVDERKDAPLMRRITGIRKQISKELGFVIPLVRIKDDMTLSPNHYRITIGGTIIAEDEIWPDDMLALDSGDIDGNIDGRPCKDPTFGMDALWITPDRRAMMAAPESRATTASIPVPTKGASDCSSGTA